MPSINNLNSISDDDNKINAFFLKTVTVHLKYNSHLFTWYILLVILTRYNEHPFIINVKKILIMKYDILYCIL